MGRWLNRLRISEKNTETALWGTDKTDKTPSEPLLSVLSGLSEGISAKISPPEIDLAELEYLFEERAGILEFDCGVPRHEAETLARQQIKETRH
ncbi:hypothetical protein [Bosea sp. PAMC 26642]|uniref:hypothetical protein n=1 Tax=Bosea sp. (strain PAMC 26642) TaxID=1792307 RepID=UPI000ACF2165|nr:hypothetical protein [Bosea sp. PAMC 26642]